MEEEKKQKASFFSVPLIIYLLHTQRTECEDTFTRVKKIVGRKRERDRERKIKREKGGDEDRT